MADRIISRAEAKAQGLLRYYSGQSCKRGHTAQRLVSNRLCIACEAERRFANAKHKTPEGKAYHQAWYRANRERVIAVDRAYRMSPAGKAVSSAYYAANKEKRVAYIKAWVNANRETYREYIRRSNSRRRAQAKGSSGPHHTAAEARAILHAQGHRCIYCRADLKKTKRHLDHIVPLSRGGSNDRTNLQYTCGPCNLRKAARDPIDFARELGLLL